MTDSPTSVPATDLDPAAPARVAHLARPTSPRWLLRGLDVVKGLVLGTVVTIGAAAQVQADQPVPAEPAVTAPHVDQRLQHLMEHERCTTTGLPEGSIPARTLIRPPARRLLRPRLGRARGHRPRRAHRGLPGPPLRRPRSYDARPAR